MDEALLAAGEVLSILMLLGDGEGRGVTRTLKQFTAKAGDHYFLGGQPRYPLVLDLFANSCLPAPEILVMLRNVLVRQAIKAGGVHSIGTYLFPFDAMYKIWVHEFGIDEDVATPLVMTTRARIGRRCAKVVVTLASMGTIELVGHVGELARLGKELAWGGKATVDIGREQLVDSIFERSVDNIQTWIHRFIAPRVSRRLRAKIDRSVLGSEDFAQIMLELLIDALLSVQDDLREKGRFMLLADAIDAAADEYDETVLLRAAVANLFIACTQSIGSGIMAGRLPANLWYEEVRDHAPSRFELSELQLDDVRDTLIAVGLEAATVDKILSGAGAPDPIYAAQLSQAYRRAVGPRRRVAGRAR